MPNINLSYNFRIGLRQYPMVHRPLRWVNRTLLPGLGQAGLELARLLSPPSPCWGPARGAYSLLPLIREGKVPGRIVLEDQGNPKLSDRPLLELCGLRQHQEQPWPVLWSQHREARLVGRRLAMMNERKEIAIETAYGPHRYRDDAGYNALHLTPPVRLEGNWTSLISQWTPNQVVPFFSHWLLDALPRLVLLKEFPADTRILVPGALAGYMKESLNLLGLIDRIRYTPETHLIVENYFFSSPTTMISCHNPYGVGALRSMFMPLADQTYCGPKQFIIQRKGKSRGIQNNDEVNDYFRKLGWEIVDTEKLTFAQEIKLFSEADAVAGILGSGFTNCVWCKPGCKVITFVADNWLDGWVEWICDVNQLDYRYEIFPADHAYMAKVDLPTVKRLLESAGLLG